MITKSNNTPTEPVPPLIKIRDAALVLSISRATVRSLIENGDLTAENLTSRKKPKRRHVRITRKSFCEFYEKRFGHPIARALENPFTT